VVALKFRGRLAAADVMAAQIAANAPPALLAGIDALVPVPPQRQRRRARGFDHAELIARALARRIGVPARRALERRGRARQLGAGRAQRLGARLEVAAPRPVAGRVALVDDVHTTGATLSACAAALRAAGAEEVVAATYARALG
jgi:ComF family protein